MSKTPAPGAGFAGQAPALKSERHFGPAQDQIAVEKLEYRVFLYAALTASYGGRSDNQVATVVKHYLMSTISTQFVSLPVGYLFSSFRPPFASMA